MQVSNLQSLLLVSDALPSELSRVQGGSVAQSVERSTPGEEVPGSISPAPYWLGRCQYNVTG